MNWTYLFTTSYFGGYSVTNRLEKYSNKKFETKNSMILVLRLDMEKKSKDQTPKQSAGIIVLSSP